MSDIDSSVFYMADWRFITSMETLVGIAGAIRTLTPSPVILLRFQAITRHN